eukprot:5709599-Alexandrium_andersonii.AAC.1
MRLEALMAEEPIQFGALGEDVVVGALEKESAIVALASGNVVAAGDNPIRGENIANVPEEDAPDW